MKINYKILWLDDKIKEFIDDELILEVENHLINEGFNPQILTCSKIDDFYSKLNNTYDLILTDFHLTEDLNGDKVVEEIRKPENAIFTEILFYTAQADLKDTEKISRITFLETNKKVGKHTEILISEVINLIDLTIKKFQHIVNMRGMIMHETSSLDVIINRFVKNYIEDSKNQENVEKILPPILSQIQKNAKEKCDKAFSNKPNKILKDNVLFSASQKVFALGEILKILEQKDFSDDYSKEIIWFRNQFAHAEIFVNEEGKEYFKIKIEGAGEELLFDEKLCKGIRKSIIKHKENLDNLELIMK